MEIIFRAGRSFPTPILYQHLTDLVFKMLIWYQFDYSTTTASVTPDTSTNEGYALRYAAGYVVRQVLKKIRAKNIPHKEDLIKCCQRLVKTHCSDDTENTAEEWTDLVDRGGLYHIKETTFQLFVALEDKVWKYLGQLSSPHAATVRDRFISSLNDSEDIQFYWCIAAAEFDVVDTDVHDHLLRMIKELFVTMRGFSYTSEWMEHYKQAHKKCTQRSKSLRKRLYTDMIL